MDTNGTIMTVNDAFTNCFGYAPEDIAGKNIKILFTEKDQAKGLPQQELQNVRTRGQSFDNNYLVNADKTITWVSGESIIVKSEDGRESILKIIQNEKVQIIKLIKEQ